MKRKRITAIVILANVVRTPGGCWLWQGKLTSDGYPRDHIHRKAYERFIGPIPRGYEVDHTCYTPACVRPKHLEAVPPEINRLRSRQRGASHHNSRKTHCVRGHPFAGKNLCIVIRANGARERSCRACRPIYKSRPVRFLPTKLRTHCVHGHPLSGDNLTVIHYRGTPKRLCRACKAIHRRRYKERRAAELHSTLNPS